ncbi:quinone-dependent dihydroorotate dehydrogenase [Longimicrobium sp.]|uniref:quinone-dependent dihydroorotate dehydrogenase n=1 Tax=Longimicrobium sp. TaxID=2029185 RepID=UPI002C1B2188|nr:quinone-dependent dihydroorotate dehydrogenase [Longimicrobium sp.]HSU16279.1 quinone-dependent dihydroorotate dehydrogenase [Longimicrobium sp.]
MLYDLLRPFLFTLPAETAHHVGSGLLDLSLAPPPLRALVRSAVAIDDPALAIERFGIRFPNPVGLAAGFDKTGEMFNALGALGFGFVEIGTVTAHAQPGNPRPRLFRLPADRALLNRMGFNNPGADAVAARLGRTRIEPVLGINLGKSKVTPLEDAAGDYLRSLELLEPFARYLVVNVSSPNTPGLRQLQDAAPLRDLLRALRRRAGELASARAGEARPVLLKIAPDLTDPQIEEAVGIAREEGMAGIIATNTTVSRDGLRTAPARVEALGAGGVSGAPLRTRAREVVSLIRRTAGGAMPIVGVGGIFTADDAWEMVRAGAALVQLYTGFIYRGPLVAREICIGLRERLRREGMRTLEEAIGSAHR